MHRQLPAQPGVVPDRIGAVGKGEQRVGAAAAGLDGHGDVARAGDDNPVGQRLAPHLEHPAPLLGREMRAAAGVRPDRDTGDRLRRHPSGVARWAGSSIAAPRNGTGTAGISPHVQPLGQERHRASPRHAPVPLADVALLLEHHPERTPTLSRRAPRARPSGPRRRTPGPPRRRLRRTDAPDPVVRRRGVSPSAAR